MVTEFAVALGAGVLGALLKDTVVRPIRDYRQARKKVAKDLIKYSHLITSPGSGASDRMDEARYEIRDDAAELRAVMEDVPAYWAWALFFVPNPSTIERAEGRLMRISNCIHTGSAMKNAKDQRQVRNLLNIAD